VRWRSLWSGSARMRRRVCYSCSLDGTGHSVDVFQGACGLVIAVGTSLGVGLDQSVVDRRRECSGKYY